MKNNRWFQGLAGRAWNSDNQIRRRQRWTMWVILAFPSIVLPLFVSEWISPTASFERIMTALGYLFSIFVTVVFLSTVGRWAFWCAIHVLVSWWSKGSESKNKPLPPRHGTGGVWFRF